MVIQTVLLAAASFGAFNQEMGDNKAASWVGKTAKAVPVMDMAGNKADLAKEFGKRPVVLVFYRGVWCPFCHKQLHELQAIEADLKAENAVVYVVSNEASDKLDAMRQAEKLGPTFVSLSDPQAKLAARSTRASTTRAILGRPPWSSARIERSFSPPRWRITRFAPILRRFLKRCATLSSASRPKCERCEKSPRDRRRRGPASPPNHAPPRPRP
jgi:peroxiredoxin